MIIKDWAQRRERLDIEYKTTTMSSLVGTLCRSFGFDVQHIHPLTGLANTSPEVFTKTRTPSYVLKGLRTFCSSFAYAAKVYADDDIPEGYPDWPGCWITARAVLIAAAKDYEEAVEVYEDMKSVCPSNWLHSEERYRLLIPFRREILRDIPLIDYGTVEGAICQLLATGSSYFSDHCGLYREESELLVKGRKEWTNDNIKHLLEILKKASSWLTKAIPTSGLAQDCTEQHRAALHELNPAQTALVWNLWPRMRQVVQQESQWICVYLEDLEQPEQPEQKREDDNQDANQLAG